MAEIRQAERLDGADKAVKSEKRQTGAHLPVRATGAAVGGAIATNMDLPVSLAS